MKEKKCQKQKLKLKENAQQGCQNFHFSIQFRQAHCLLLQNKTIIDEKTPFSSSITFIKEQKKLKNRVIVRENNRTRNVNLDFLSRRQRENHRRRTAACERNHGSLLEFEFLDRFVSSQSAVKCRRNGETSEHLERRPTSRALLL